MTACANRQLAWYIEDFVDTPSTKSYCLRTDVGVASQERRTDWYGKLISTTVKLEIIDRIKKSARTLIQ